MGKALLVLVLGSGLVLTKQLYNTTVTEERTSKDQRAYQEEVIAREIAASAFNVGMGELRAYGDEVLDAAVALNGPDNEGRSGTYSTGRFAGGSYTVRAEPTSGHSVRVIATGTFGDAEYTMHDEYRVFVLTAERGGLVDVSFLKSMAGYCSAVFLEMYTMDMEEGETPEPIMIFAPDNRDRTTARPARLVWAEPGTQLNFYIAVDQNCSLRADAGLSECELREYAREYNFGLSGFDHVHHALKVQAGDLDQAEEDIWAFVEQNPNHRNVWRIGWEDIHNTSWDRPDSDDPRNSLQATKRFGYEGLGWPDTDSDGYRKLIDFGNQPDFDDQVIEVHVISPYDSNYQGKVNQYRNTQEDCGEEYDEIPENPYGDPDPDPTPDPTPDPETDPDPEPDPDPTPDPDPEPEDDDEPSDPVNDFACECRQNWKNPVLHRPPGNESNEQLLCLPDSGMNNHLRKHNDVVLSCRN